MPVEKLLLATAERSAARLPSALTLHSATRPALTPQTATRQAWTGAAS